MNVLAAAHDVGIRHFDVAPLYGLGLAEAELGRFLRGRRDTVTVTTKFGLAPGAGVSAFRSMQGIARRLLAMMPAVKQRLQNRPRPLAARQSFDTASAEFSLDRSLRLLGTDHVDYFLLHEPTPELVDRDRPLEYLERERERGRIRAFGLAGPLPGLLGIQRAFPSLAAVLQYPFEACGAATRSVGRTSFVYGCVAPRLRKIQAMHAASDDAPASWRLAFPELSLNDPTLPRLLLAGCRIAEPGATVLFGSTSPTHVRQMSGELTEDEIRLAKAVSRWLDNGGKWPLSGTGVQA